MKIGILGIGYVGLPLLSAFCQKDINCIIHLAALADIVPSINYPEKYYKTNVTGTVNLLNLARQNNIKKVIKNIAKEVIVDGK